MKTIFRCRAHFRRDRGRSTTRRGRSTATPGSPPGRTSPSTCTRPSPHPTSPSLRSVNKTGDHGWWIWQCALVFGSGHANVHIWGAGGLFTHPASPKLKRARPHWLRPPNACGAHPRPIVACNLDTRGGYGTSIEEQTEQKQNSTLEKILKSFFDRGFWRCANQKLNFKQYISL